MQKQQTKFIIYLIKLFKINSVMTIKTQNNDYKDANLRI